MAAILFLEVVIFSDKEKLVFQLLWKNNSSHKKNYKTKKFYIIELTSDQSLKCYSQKSDFLKNAENFKICQNLNLTFFRTIIAKGWKITNEGYFSFHIGANTYVHGFMMLNRHLDLVHWHQRSMYWSRQFMPTPPAPCMNLNSPPQVGLWKIPYLTLTTG